MIPLFDDTELDDDCEALRRKEDLKKELACNDEEFFNGDDAA